jgi:hypothetical protein
MKWTRGAQFYTRLDKVMNETTVTEFTYNIEYKQMVYVDLTIVCLKQ